MLVLLRIKSQLRVIRLDLCIVNTHDNAVDGGWYFMSGLESDEYMNNANNMVVYDLNTLAHCDESIILWFYRQRL